MRIEELFDHPQPLPSMPRLVQELISSFDADEIDFRRMGDKLSTDPVLSARVLRLANSAYYHCSRPIGTVDDALTMLGFGAVRTLVISSGLAGSFRELKGLDLPEFWRFSLLAAVAARALSRPARLNGEVAFTVGLMHAIGQLVMHTRMPDEMQHIARVASTFDPLRLEVERRALGYTHADVGAMLASRWRFPPLFVTAIAGFPAPLASPTFEPMAALLQLAIWRARGEQNGDSDEQLASSMPAATAAAIGLSVESVLALEPPSKLAEGLESLLA
jgi:HD-like signal output (HDOD) protein